jgi:hypothetical protein
MFLKIAFPQHPAPRRRDGTHPKAASCGRTPHSTRPSKRAMVWSAGTRHRFFPSGRDPMFLKIAFPQHPAPRRRDGTHPKAASCGRTPHSTRPSKRALVWSAGTRHRFFPSGRDPMFLKIAFPQHPAPRRRDGTHPKAASCGRTPHSTRPSKRALVWSAGTRHRFFPSGRDPMFLKIAFPHHPAPRRRDGTPPKAASCGRTPHSTRPSKRAMVWSAGTRHRFFPSGRDPMFLKIAFPQHPAPRRRDGTHPKAASCGRTPHSTRPSKRAMVWSAGTRHRFFPSGRDPMFLKIAFPHHPAPRRRDGTPESGLVRPHSTFHPPFETSYGLECGDASPLFSLGSRPDVSEDRFSTTPRPAPSRRHPPESGLVRPHSTFHPPFETSSGLECGDASPLFSLGSRPDVSEDRFSTTPRPAPSRRHPPESGLVRPHSTFHPPFETSYGLECGARRKCPQTFTLIPKARAKAALAKRHSSAPWASRA